MVIGQPEQDEIIYLYEGKKTPINLQEQFVEIKQFNYRIEKLRQGMRKKGIDKGAPAQIKLSEDGIYLQQSGLFGWVSLGKRPNSKTVLLVPDFLRPAITKGGNHSKQLDDFARVFFNLFSLGIIKDRRIHYDNQLVTASRIDKKETPMMLFANAFMVQLERSITYGLSATYNHYRIRPKFSRGRLVMGRIIPDIFTRPHQLLHDVTVFDNDTPVNRLLRWCATYLANNRDAGRSRYRLEELATMMGDIPPILPSVDQRKLMVHLPPLQSHLQDAVNIARIIADVDDAKMGGNIYAFPGLLINANDAFEDYCRVFIRECLQESELLDGYEVYDGNDLRGGEKSTKKIPQWIKDKVKIVATYSSGPYSGPFIQYPDIIIANCLEEDIPMVLDAKHTNLNVYERSTGENVSVPNPEYRNQTIVAAAVTGARICGLVEAVGMIPQTREPFSLQEVPTEWDLSLASGSPRRFILTTFDPLLMLDPVNEDVIKQQVCNWLEGLLVD